MLNSKYLKEPLKDLETKFIVRFIDLPGRGQTPFPSDSQVSFIGDIWYIEKVRQEHNDKKVNFLAHSFGGYIALGYLNLFPNFVDKIILVSTPLFINDSIYNKKVLEINKRFNLDSIRTKEENLVFLIKFNFYDTSVVMKNYLKAFEDCLLTFDTSQHFQIMNKIYHSSLEENWKKVFQTQFLEIELSYFKIHKNKKFLVCFGIFDEVGFLDYTMNNIEKLNNVDLKVYRTSHLPFYEEHNKFIQDVCKFLEDP